MGEDFSTSILTFREELTKDNFQIADDALGIREGHGVFGELS